MPPPRNGFGWRTCRRSKRGSSRTTSTSSTSSSRSPEKWGRTPFFLFAGVLHVGKLVELDVPVLAALLLHAPDVDRLHDVARGRVDRNRSPGTGELEPLEGLHRLVAVDLAA